MKKLTQDVFKGAPNWVLSAAVDGNGVANYFSVPIEHLVKVRTFIGGIWLFMSNKSDNKFKKIGKGYDVTDWQNSAIDREL